MPFRSSFTCLWCGRAWTVRDPSDLEGWAHLCPDCVGRAGENGFLRFRLKSALAGAFQAGSCAGRCRRRGARCTLESDGPLSPRPTRPASPNDIADDLRDEMVGYYAARAPEYDDWYLRRGRYSRGPIHDMAWQMDLDAAGTWLDRQDVSGRDRRTCCRHRLVVAPPGPEGRALGIRRVAGTTRPCP